jgi:hypothetical protein
MHAFTHENMHTCNTHTTHTHTQHTHTHNTRAHAHNTSTHTTRTQHHTHRRVVLGGVLSFLLSTENTFYLLRTYSIFHTTIISHTQACGLGGVVPLLSSLFLDSRVSSILFWSPEGEEGESKGAGWVAVFRWGAKCALEALKVCLCMCMCV